MASRHLASGEEIIAGQERGEIAVPHVRVSDVRGTDITPPATLPELGISRNLASEGPESTIQVAEAFRLRPDDDDVLDPDARLLDQADPPAERLVRERRLGERPGDRGGEVPRSWVTLTGTTRRYPGGASGRARASSR